MSPEPDPHLRPPRPSARFVVLVIVATAAASAVVAVLGFVSALG